MQPLPKDSIEVGRVIDAYGVKGSIKIHPFSHSADGLLHVHTWFLKNIQTNTHQILTVQHVKWHNNCIIAQLYGVNNRNQAEDLRANTVWINANLLPKTQLNEYYWNDLIGCQVFDIKGQLLGIVLFLLETGVHAVLHIDCGKHFEPLFIPFVNQWVEKIDVNNKSIHTQWEYQWLESIK